MSVQTRIPKGYRLTVTSWENDGDSYNTTITEGLTLPQVKLLVELALLHKSKNNWPAGFGNMYEPNDREQKTYVAAMRTLFKRHPPEAMPDENIAEYLDTEDFGDCAHEFVHDLFGSSEFYTRVYESHKVEWIPEDILIEDVTKTLNQRIE